MDIRKAETLRDTRDSLAQDRRKLHIITTVQFTSPKLAIPDPLLQIRVREEVFAVEAGGPLADARVQFVEVVGTADHHDAVVVLQAVDLVEEVGAHVVGDDAVEVFEDEEAGRHLTRLAEDLTDGVLGADEAGETPDVQRGDGVVALVERMHHRLDRNGLPVARRAVEDDAPLPGDAELGVPILRVEEFAHFADDALLHSGVQDDVVPARFLDGPPHLGVVLPIPTVENEDGIGDGILPRARREHERVILQGRGAEEIAHRTLVDTVGPGDAVEDVFLSLPLVHPFAKLHRIVEEPVSPIDPPSRRHVSPVFQILDGVIICIDRSCAGVPSCGVGEELAFVSGNDGEVEGGVLLPDRVDQDHIAIDTGGGRVVVELSVDCIMARGSSHGSG